MRTPPEDRLSSGQSGIDNWLDPRGIKININQDDDPRTGSAREDSDGGGTVTTLGNKSDSLSKLGATFIPVGVFTVVCVLLFIVLRKKLKRVYSPRTIHNLRSPERTSPELPSGWLNWILPFFRLPDTFVLNHGSIDGFFFLRYLKILRNICLAGCAITWPVLFPLHATGGGGLAELEILTMGNIAAENNSRLFANAVIAWVFFGFIIYMIVRESIYFINLRQAYLSSEHYAQRLSSRTVMITCVPDHYLDQHRLRKLYGDSVRRIWIPQTDKTLANAVKEREQTAQRLEKAEIALIKKANAVRVKQLQQEWKTQNKNKPKSKDSATEMIAEPKLDQTSTLEGPRSPDTFGAHPSSLGDTQSTTNESFQSHPELHGRVANHNSDQLPNVDGQDMSYVHPYGYNPSLPDVRGSVAALWIGAEQRPSHRPIGRFGRSVDTIRWTRDRLRDLNRQIYQLQRSVRRGQGVTLPAAFIEFEDQESAQAAQQVLAHHRPLQMSPRLLGIRPDEVVWSALGIPWWQRIIRRFAMMGLITAAIIFWAIPSAVVGTLSNLDTISTMFPFMSWLTKLPKPITGFLQGFVPAIALSLFMSLVPGMVRICARVAGVPSLSKVELFTQTAYFAFQVVQVFLVTTLTSAASSSIASVLAEPLEAPSLLAKTLPSASNFYLSYILIQCLANGAVTLIHPFDLLRHLILPKISDLPRAHYRLWRRMLRPWWGKEFPVVSNLGVIALAYSCISPLVLIFAAGGMAFMHTVWKYNLIYVLDSDMDTKGLFYPRALLHLIVGMYLATLCLIGLFAVNLAFGPMALMILFLVVAGLIHVSLNEAIAPYLQCLPQTLRLEDEIQEEERAKREREEESRRSGNEESAGAAASYYDPEEQFGDEEGNETPPSDVDEDDHQITGTRGGTRGGIAVEGAASVKDTVAAFLSSRIRSSARQEADNSGLTRWLNDLKIWGGSDPSASTPSALARFLHPEIHEDFIALRKMLPAQEDLPDVGVPDSYKGCQYMPPEMWTPKPMIWIPEDEGRVSKQEVNHTRKFAGISDKGATLDEKGRIIVDLNNAPYDDEKLLL